MGGVTQHQLIADDPSEILKSPHLDVVPYAARVSMLSERLGIDLSTTIFVLTVIPLCQNRSRHAEMRRIIAAQIAERSDALKAALAEMVAQRLAPLTRPGPVDVMADVVSPLVGDVISVLIGVPLRLQDSGHISRVFSQVIGVSKRRKLEQELRDLRAALTEAVPDADDLVIGMKLSLAILGRDALMGTLGCSLHQVIAQGEGRAFDQIDWPQLPPRTGVPYIDRMALCPVSVAGKTYEPGAVLRGDLARLEQSDDARAPMSFFGAGAHLCLGRAISLDLWKVMMVALRTSGARARVQHYSLRRDDVFHVPETFLLEMF